MKLSTIGWLVIAGVVFDLIDGISFIHFQRESGVRIFDFNTWKTAPSYFDYMKTSMGLVLSVLAVLPWITLIGNLYWPSKLKKYETA